MKRHSLNDRPVRQSDRGCVSLDQPRCFGQLKLLRLVRNAAAILSLLLFVWVPVQAATQVGSAPYRTSATGAGNSHSPVFSADGRHIAFVSHANNLVTNDDLAPHLDLFVRDLVASNTVLVSVSTNGIGGGNDNVALYTLSSNAQLIAFETAANTFAAGDTNRFADIYVRDLAAGTTRLLSVNTSGTGSGNGPSSNPLISEDGRYIVFESLASNLVTNDFNGTNDIFIHDLTTGITELVSVNADGTASPAGPSHSPSTSANGGIVTFVSHATNVVAGVTNRLGEIYVRNVFAGSNQWLAASPIPPTKYPSPAGPTVSPYQASDPAVTPDGRFVAFKTGSGAVVRFDTSNPTNWSTKLYNDGGTTPSNNVYYFLQNPRVHRFHSGAVQAPLAFSSDGRFLAASVRGASSTNVFRVDFDTDELECCTGCCDGNGAGFNSYQFSDAELVSTNLITNSLTGSLSQPLTVAAPAISADGRRVAFLAGTRPAFSGLLQEPMALFLRDMNTNTAFLVGSNSAGASGPDLADINPVISPDGSLIAWDSPDGNIIAGDLNRAWDVFVRDVDTGDTHLVSKRHPSLPASGGTALSRLDLNPGAISANGERLAILSLDNTLAPNDTNNWRDLVVRDLVSGTNFDVSRSLGRVPFSSQTNFPGTNTASGPFLSADGRFVAFSGETLFTTGNTNRTIYWRDLQALSNRVVVGSQSNPAGVSHPVLSSSGRMVAFHSSDIHDLFYQDGNGQSDVFVRLMTPHPKLLDCSPTADAFAPTFISVAWGTTITANGPSQNGVFSPDSGSIVFQSRASNLLQSPIPPQTTHQLYGRSVWITNRFNDGCWGEIDALGYGPVSLISYTTSASPALSGTSTQLPLPGGAANPRFSADSHYVAFEGSSNLIGLIYRHDLRGGWVTNITAHPESSFTIYLTNLARVTNDLVCTGCQNPTLSGDGRFVAYQSGAASAPTTGIFVKDMATGQEELISVDLTAGASGNAASFNPLISHDARYVVFASKASNLVSNDANQAADIFVRDRTAGATHCLSRNWGGTGTGNRVSSNPIMSADGRTVAFQSFASDLLPGDYNDTRDVFVVSLAGPDSDGDGMDDDWEMAYFSTLSRDGTGDFDGDGSSDRDEFRASSNPANDASILRVIQITSKVIAPPPLNFQQTAVLWSAAPGKTYRVQFKDGFDAPWTDLSGNVTAGGTSASIIHTDFSAPSRRFYRVLLAQ